MCFSSRWSLVGGAEGFPLHSSGLCLCPPWCVPNPEPTLFSVMPCNCHGRLVEFTIPIPQTPRNVRKSLMSKLSSISRKLTFQLRVEWPLKKKPNWVISEIFILCYKKCEDAEGLYGWEPMCDLKVRVSASIRWFWDRQLALCLLHINVDVHI